MDSTMKISLRDDMTRNEMVSWFSDKLQRYPTAVDVYETAVELYNIGDYQKVVAVLEYYSSFAERDIPGIHLLGYAYYMCGKIDRALTQFIHCAESFEADWQLIIEISIELEAQKKAAERMVETQKAVASHIDSIVAASNLSVKPKSDRFDDDVGLGSPTLPEPPTNLS